MIPIPMDTDFYYQFLGRSRYSIGLDEWALWEDDRLVVMRVRWPEGDGGLIEGGEGFPI